MRMLFLTKEKQKQKSQHEITFFFFSVDFGSRPSERFNIFNGGIFRYLGMVTGK